MIITGIESDSEIAQIKAKLLGSFLLFTQTFFKLKTGRDFVLSAPVSREPHQISIAKQLTNIFNLKSKRCWMTLPPGHGKSTFVTYFIPWCFAHYPDCKFIYISYSADLASNHTSNIKAIMELAEYRELFGVEISRLSSAKDNFLTNYGGAVKAFGSCGAVTGNDAGLPNLDRFSGAVIMDDMHKPDEVFSDTMRQSVIDNFNNTIKTRPRGENVPIIGIGHALHEDDLQAFLLDGRDGYKWDHLLLAAEDEHGNILAPNLMTRKMLDAEKEFNEYVYYAQYMGKPRPAGGGIFKTEDIVLLDDYPRMLCTFITCDTAESTKDYADYSVFSFWGFYEIIYRERKTGDFGLHWIDCVQKKIEPCDLENELTSFYTRCLDFNTKPLFVAIEKKSSGTTLISSLKKMRGIVIRDIERTRASGSKTARYLEAQPYVSKRLVSINRYSPHTQFCLDHISKITANGTHRNDDIADTMYDAIKIALISKSLSIQMCENQENLAGKKIMEKFNYINKIRESAWEN
jgi:predicted phage terminase large subunit-like protein